MDANLYILSEKNKFNHHDSDNYCPTSIKETIKWFPFLTTMKHNKNNIDTKLWANIIIINGIFHV